MSLIFSHFFSKLRLPLALVLKDENEVTLKGDEEVKSRWKEYFEEMYNDPNTVNINVLSELQKNS